MRKVNTNDVEVETWKSPKGKYAGSGKSISEALGRVPKSTDLNERHPFDVEIQRIAPGQTPYPYHAHSAQWEFYHVISGTGTVRDESGTTSVIAGDAWMCKPGEAHQITNDGTEDLVLYVVADNPFGESVHFPESEKLLVRTPQPMFIRGYQPSSFYDGEE